MTAYQGWLLMALVGFSLGPLGISLWLASSILSVLRKKRGRLLAGAAVLAILLATGYLPGLKLYGKLSESSGAPITGKDVLLLGYLHLGLLVGLGIILVGRRRAPRSGVPPTREVDLGLGRSLLSVHRARNPKSPFPRIPFNQVYQVLRRDWEVPVELGDRPLPPELDGFTILHLSDIHLGDYLVPEYFERIREEVSAIPRDVLVFTGDFLHARGRIEDLKVWLRGLGSGGPAYAVLGNHDSYDHPIPGLKAALRDSGVELVGGEVAVVSRGAAAVAFAGLDYQNWWRPFPVSALRRRIPPGALPVLLAHTPCVFPRAEAEGFPLVLCGHTHGGQIRFPGIGALFIPARYGRRYQMGLYRWGRSHLHVHSGLGGPPPLRISCAPEITRLVLVGNRQP